MSDSVVRSIHHPLRLTQEESPSSQDTQLSIAALPQRFMFQRVYFVNTQLYDYPLNASISILSHLVNCNLNISFSSSQAPYSPLPVTVSALPAYAQLFAPPFLPEPVLSLELAALQILVEVIYAL